MIESGCWAGRCLSLWPSQLSAIVMCIALNYEIVDMQYSLGKRGRSPVWDQLHPICWILQVTSDKFFENESLMLETYFTFGPLSKTSFFVTKTGTEKAIIYDV